MTIAIWDTAIAEQEHDLMSRLGSQADEVPEHVGILQVSLGIPLLRVDEAREEDRVANEEDRRVVANQVPDALVGVEFQGEAARIARRVGGAAFAACNASSTQTLFKV